MSDVYFCRKVCYPSRADAKREADKKPSLRIYACPECGYWHLTSVKPTEYKRKLKAIRKQSKKKCR